VNAEQSFVRIANVLAMRKFARSVANVMRVATANARKNRFTSRYSWA